MVQVFGRAGVRLHARLGIVCLLALLASACGKSRDTHGQTSSTSECNRCHGGPDNAAPPMATQGDRDTTSVRVGAHQAHVTGTRLRAAIPCEECHVVPATIGAPGHIDGDHATVTFGALARSGGVAPQWSRDPATCGATYCHGGTLHGGRITAPTWTKVDGTQAACGTCHGTPPPRPHVQYTTCGKCHTGYAPGVVANTTHIDGKTDYVALACNTCHGTAANAAPPIGTAGETETTALAVGAHQAHVLAGRLRGPMGCPECHVVPTEMLHADGVAEVTWGALATTSGASPAWIAGSATCASTYCHGGTFTTPGDGGLKAPVWTRVDGSQAACGTCHGAPPPVPHPQNPSCNRCHPATVLASGALDVAGGHHVDGTLDVGPLTCSSCHGTDGVNAAPPIGTRGETDTTALAVGAHQSHVRGGAIRGPMGCEECHVVPTSMLHANGVIDVTWGALATNGGLVPVFSAGTATCSATYCHGAGFAPGDGTLKTPVWTKVDGTQAACGSCHGAPPPAPHPQNAACNRCHPATVLASGAIDVAGGHHIDGTLDVGPLSCSSCHGSAVNPAPPIGTRGEADTSALAVGAHQAHVVGGAIRGPMGCAECHVVPTTMLHANGVAEVTWGALATTGGLGPVFSAASATCAATYCHGASFTTPGDGTLKTPVWTRVDGTQAACGTCHGDPPPAPHPANPVCNRCHPATVLASGAIDVAGGHHVDGTLDVGPLTCTSCHGTDGVNAAPPIGTRGETATTALAVGAHQAHVLGGAIRGPIGCQECHVVPTSMVHANGTVNLTWGALATNGGAAPVFSAATATCSATYCHGATLTTPGDGTIKTPVWTRVDGTQAACGTCHGFPPPLPHPGDTSCSRCHKETVDATGAILVAGGKHIDGTVEVSGGACSACHGSDANPAPPLGTLGETATTTLAVGAHQAHVTDGTIRRALACSDCHVVPSTPLHANGIVDMAWSALATGGGATRPALDTAAATCAATYCHGATLAGGGSAKTPIWTRVDGTQMTCGSCHGDPPAAPHPANPVCSRCHPSTVLASGTIDVAGGYHLNGAVDVGPLTCTSCHGTEGVNAAPPIGTRGETATTALAVGAHQAHVLGGTMRGPIDCSECHTVPTDPLHANGTVDLTWGPLATASGATATFDAGTARCSNYCHGESLAPSPGDLRTPIWTEVDGTQAACGTCHGIPPATNHPQSTQCSACHQDTVDASGKILVAGGKHIDGIVEISGGGCSACHGSSANPAPPVGTHGETATTTLAVGAHQAHVNAGAIRNALACSDCHLVPTSLANHPDGTVHMAWSALATGNGATAPVLDAAAATCAATYCHGATLTTGGSAKTPIWTKVDGTQAQCGSCHGDPPGNWHPANPLCNSCHPLTVAVDGTVDVAGGRHIDGTVEVAGLTCHSCHGSTANPAPPVDTKGNSATTFVGVGAHQAHLLGGAIRGPIDCSECHVVPTETLHATGTVTLTWGPLATASGATATFEATGATCSNYCHGATLRNAGDGSLKTPVWTKVDGTQAACGTCHGFPPPTNHPQTRDCYLCHQDTVDANGNILVAGGKHIDGVLEVAGGGCSGCHGSSANPAPPVGTHGETATTTLAVGAHQAHVNDGAIRTALACSDCHLVPTSLATHPDGTVHMAWSALATGNGATTPVLDTAAATCAATYCHGATLATPGGNAKTPIWTKVDGTQAQCGSCHGNPPGNWHPANPLCNSCHPLTVAVDGTIDVAGGRHIDGTVEVAGLTCHSCHGSTDDPAPPVDTKGNSATTFVGVGAHQAHVKDGPLRQAMDCTECHVVPTDLLHANGTVDLTWGPLATSGGTTPVFDATNATCAATYCHGALFRADDGTLKTPIWTKVDGTQAACGTCHGYPPPPDHPQSAQCNLCHKDTVAADGTILVANGTHIDGRIEAGGDCGTCHGIPPANGAHAAHAAFPDPKVPAYGDLRIVENYTPAGFPAYQFGCGHCHPLDPAKHMDLVVEVELSPGAAPAGTLKSLNARSAAYDKSSGTCSGAYCHSSGQLVPSYAVTPGWSSGATLGCDACHSNPPAYASGGAGAPIANSHLGLSDTGREFGHFAGLAGPLHDTKHGGGVYGAPSQGAAPITCQTCHYETTDPTSTGRSGFYWLDTRGRYELPGGDPARKDDPRWKASQCGTCHVPSGPAPAGNGRVLPLRHVNGRRDVVFDPRTALAPYDGLPAAPDLPTRPYWLTHVTLCDPLPAGATIDGTTLSLDLSAARWDPATKTCTSVACHLAENPTWGGGYVASPSAATPSCCQCHGGSRCGR